MASQLTSLMTVYLTVYSGTDQSKHQSSTSLGFGWGIHRWPVNSSHKRPVTRKMLPFDDVIKGSSKSQICPRVTMRFLSEKAPMSSVYKRTIAIFKTLCVAFIQETFSALLALCAGNSPVTGEFPAQMPVTRSFDVFVDLRLNKRLSKNREAGDIRRHDAHYDDIIMH